MTRSSALHARDGESLPELLWEDGERRLADPSRTVQTPVEQLDLAIVLKILQAVSGETDLEKLIATVMSLSLEHAGAERGLLILPRAEAYRVEAEAKIANDEVVVALRPSSITAADLPESVFHYVLRTRESVVLEDAAADNPFSDDDYMRQHPARSVLCLPLLKQTRLVGVLYLENNLASGVFTPARMTLLKLLASEAAISIENARLYRDLQEREREAERAEHGLRKAYGHLAEAQRLSKTGSFITDLLVDERDWSEETFRIFEFDPATKITLHTMRKIVHPEDLSVFDAAYKRVIEGADLNLAYRIITRSGKVKHLHAVAHVLEWIAGRPVFIGAIQDVTTSKVAEEDLNRARSDLAHVSRATTLGTLTASIAHEINQPLSGIITNASTCLRMLNADPPNVDGARETARRTLRDGNRASDVITRLRALFSKKEVTLEPLNLSEATREVIALSLSDLQRNRVVLQSELAADLPAITGDRIQLQQVILNLLRNASDAMAGVHDRPRQLLIRTEREDGDRVRLTVRDAGVGFDPQSMDKLFDAFHTTKSDGMGIGLSVSRSIVERHHGRLWAQPNDGPGATFSFSIPRAPESVADGARAPRHS
jgi:signal transduction histidine kinase